MIPGLILTFISYALFYALYRLSTNVLFIALYVGILFDLFPDAVTNVILSKQSLFQISKIVAVGAAASAKYTKHTPVRAATYYTYIPYKHNITYQHKQHTCIHVHN